MNLSWDPQNLRFVAVFSSDFQGDLAAVKAAGFKTDGPSGGWIWYTYKAGPLTTLRENRPTSGLTISQEAREQYTSLWAVEQNNEKVKAELATHKKALKKKLKIEVEQITHAVHIPEKGYIEASDLPPAQSVCKQFIPPNKPTTLCIICGDPVYFYEKQNPPTCLWDEKIVLDNCGDVC
jgi:hypothetical protein